jgi:hypothetical protein
MGAATTAGFARFNDGFAQGSAPSLEEERDGISERIRLR